MRDKSGSQKGAEAPVLAGWGLRDRSFVTDDLPRKSMIDPEIFVKPSKAAAGGRWNGRRRLPGFSLRQMWDRGTNLPSL